MFYNQLSYWKNATQLEKCVEFTLDIQNVWNSLIN